jgi:aminoglycoside phosphotransferase (APT) family kinase protein
MAAMDRRFLSKEPIAVGRTAEVFGYEDDKVVKLLRPGFKRTLIADEEAKVAAAHAAGAPAPATYGTVEVSGRIGLVLDRIEGESMLDEASLDTFAMGRWGKVLGDLHGETLSHTSDDLPRIIDVLAEKIEQADITAEHRKKALDVLAAAPDDHAVLHGDVHPGNVILTNDGPVLIDWIDATRGSPSADIARTLWLLSPATVSAHLSSRRIVLTAQGFFRRAYLKRVLKVAGVDRRVVDAWRLPVVAARIAEGIAAEDVALHAEVRRLTGG